LTPCSAAAVCWRITVIRRGARRAKRVAELPDGLQVVLTSTDLASGRALRISQNLFGGWELGLAGAPPQLSLVDGGVHDNLGLEWFQGRDRGRPDGARACDFILAVDASGALLRISQRRFGWRLSLFRSQGAQYAQTRASRARWFVDQLTGGQMDGLLPGTRGRRARPLVGAAQRAKAALRAAFGISRAGGVARESCILRDRSDRTATSLVRSDSRIT
jgi:hypothetical protein